MDISDILLGRGGRRQHNAFHQAFLDQKDHLYRQYLTSTRDTVRRGREENYMYKPVMGEGKRPHKRNILTKSAGRQ